LGTAIEESICGELRRVKGWSAADTCREGYCLWADALLHAGSMDDVSVRAHCFRVILRAVRSDQRRRVGELLAVPPMREPER
jgi:hypothetical protein